MYKSGTYILTWEDSTGFHRSPVFETEQEARHFGNCVWKHRDVTEVEIVKCVYRHQRRHTETVASAHK